MNYLSLKKVMNKMDKEIIDYISETVDSLDKIIQYLQTYKEKTREQDIAIQKLEEAVFWLSYGVEDDG